MQKQFHGTIEQLTRIKTRVRMEEIVACEGKEDHRGSAREEVRWKCSSRRVKCSWSVFASFGDPDQDTQPAWSSFCSPP